MRMYRMCKDSVNKQLLIKMCDIFLHVYGRKFITIKMEALIC